ncbi:filamentous hemagglutinin N-terminal domain-containing protein [Pseudomonas sp. LA21]|uniref:two-partner secretion domain-containing protein n=1 Tax=Pseudomonas sp. LA21 TaxID=2893373 RepID=UPI001FB6C1B9|nr:filamentous hemagglutinin N-terminal domain-containing protein [Pseudomonas sp. LA21]MCJ1884706.1 filamentous hemagglutinin N-terminal domain-containing protein [Pseudomonas sp. LA21]
MDIRHPACKLIASVLSGLLILNPIVAAAAELAVDAAAGGNTQIGAAGNGVPVVNIATPNGAGLSHNKFSDYNVGQKGLILNNATGKTQSTQLGGIIIGNPNLKGGAAQKILNEVNGANPSQLRGYTEVAGQSAHVIVANPNGITCNGCGFINTPRATLTTGKPILNGGRLQGYDVDGGDIAIEGAGLNASNLDRFELITRSAKLNADLYANQLDVVTGRNQVDAETLAATAKPDNGSAKPQLAIDSSALGGMYAGAIRLVGTEQGVGVKLAGNMAASAGDIRIDANGQLSLAQTSTAGSLRAKAQDISVNAPAYAAGNVELQANGALNNQGQLAAGSRIQLHGAQVSNSGIVEAGINPDNSRNAQGDVAINAQNVRNSGSVVASRSLDVNASGTLDNQGGSLRGANTTLGATTLNNQGRVLAGNALSLSAQQLSNVNGQVGAQSIQVRGGSLDNRFGLFSAEQTLSLQLGSLNNQGGTLSSRGALVADISGTLDNSRNGTLVSAGDQRLNAGQMSNRGGRVSSQGALSLNADQLDNRAGSVVSATHLNLTGSGLDNRDQGLVSAGQGAQLTLDSLNNAGAIQSDGALRLHARTVANAAGGQIAAKGDLNAQVGSLTQNGGELLSEAYLQVSAQQIDNHQGGWIGAMQGIELQADALFNQGGEISSRGVSNLRIASVDNSAGRIVSDGQLQWQGDNLVNRAGSLVGQGGLSVISRTLDNSQGGKLSSQRDLNLALTDSLNNQSGGQLLSEGALSLSATQIDNRVGLLSSGGPVKVTSTTLNNQGGQLVTDRTLMVTAPTLDNRQGGVLSAKGTISLRGTTLLNSQSGRILGGADLLLAHTRVDNSDKGRIEAAGRVTGQVQTLDQHGAGQLVSNGGIDLDFAGGSLDNSVGGLLATPGQLLLRNLAQLNNSAGGEVSSQQRFALHLATLDNRGGKLLGDGALNLTAQTLDNRQGGVISAKGALDLRGESLLNSQSGRILAGADLQLAHTRVDNSGKGRIEAVGRVAGQVKTLDQHGAGQLVSNGGIDLDFAGGSLDNSTGGLLATPGALLLRNLTQLNNSAGGEVSSQQGFALSLSGLNNQGGKLLSDGALNLTAQTIDNRQSGVISAKGSLTLRGAALLNSQSGRILGGADLLLAHTRVDNSDKGRIEAVGRVSGQIQTLDQHSAGQLVSNGGIDLDFAGGSLDNSAGGLLASAGTLQLRNLVQLSNSAGGEVSSQGNLALQSATLNNQGGKLLSDAALNVAAQSLDNRQGGVISAKGALNLRGATLLNSQSGRILGGANLLLAQTRVDNSDHGRIEAVGRVTGQIQTLDQHSAGQLVSNGGIDLDFAGGSLDNSVAGLLATPGALLLRNLAQLNNSVGGEVSSQQGFALHLTALNNQGGKLLSEGALNLTAHSIDNRQDGWIGALQGIELQAAELLNQGGEISSRTRVSIDAGQLDNSAGRIASDDLLQLRSDNLANQAGDLIGQGGVTLRGGNLNNRQGLLSSQRDIHLELSGTLDNQAGGQLISEGALNVNAAQVDNRSGVLSSGGAVAVTSSILNNQGGKLLTDSTLNVNAQTLDNRQGGVISAKGALGLRGTNLLNSQSGRILGGADLLLVQARVDNSGQGRIEVAGRVSGQVKALDQHGAGRLIGSSGIDLDFAGGNLDNSAGGLLATPRALLLRNLAQLNNSNGGELSSQQSVLLALADLNNQGGRILSSDVLTLRAQSTVDNSQAGVLFGRNQLQLNAHDLNNSQGGTLASQGAIQASLDGALDNHADGALAAGSSLSVTSASLNNQAGSLSAGQELRLATHATDNQGGRIIAQGQLNATAGDLDNRNGILSGQQGQSLEALTLDNRAGLITTQGRLELSASRVDNSQGGELSSGGELQLRVQQLIQQQGRLITGGDLTLDMAGSDFDNRNAVLSVGGLLRIDNLRHLDNRGGEISSQNSFQLSAASLDNGDAGRIISAGQLQLTTGALRNANQALLSGWQGLLINAADLDNSASGTLSSKQGSLELTLSGKLDNHGEGALVSLGDQHIRAANLDNRGGILSGQQNLDLAIAGMLDNSTGGLINAQQHLALNLAQTDILNQGGQISAGSLDLTARSLDNSGGLLLSQGALHGTLSGALINANNARLASGGELLLRAASLNNRGGQLASQQRLELTAGSLDNSQRGTLASQQDLTLNLGTGTLDNSADGLLHSASGAIALQAGQLRNQGGTLNSQRDAQLQLSGLLDNSQQGRIQSRAGQLLLQSDSLDNSAGGILYSATGLLRLLTGSFNNNAGITQAQQLDITANGGLDNRGGHLSAVTGDNRITTTTVDNQGGGLYAGNLLSVRGDTLLNQGGQVGAHTLDFSLGNSLLNQNGLIESSGSFSLSAGAIDNRGGRLRALGQSGSTTLNAGYLDNRNGRLETANTDLALSLGGLANDGGTFLHVGTGQFGVNAGQIVQAGGSFITTGHLDITADSWSNSSVLQAGWLNLNIGQFTQTASGKLLASQALTGRGGNWNNDGLLASDGTLDIQLTGTYSGAGRVTSLGALNLSANRIDLANNGSIAGGQNLTLGASQLDNHGRITATGDLTANTGALNNFATLGSTGRLQINTGDLTNDGQLSGALIFSGDDMALRVGGTLTNRYADIYSLGDLDITGATPDALAGALKNISATLESLGDMSLRVRTTENRTDVLNTTAGELLSAAIGVRCYDCTAAPQIGETRVPSSHLVWVENYRGELGESSPSAAISAGGNLNIEGQSLLNQASTIAASGNIAMRLDSFTNSGVAIGDYSVRRSFEIPYSTSGAYGDLSAAVSFWNQVMAYNAANDPDYDSGLRSPSGDMTRPNLHFWNRDWDESLELVTIRAGGREATRFGQFGSIRVEFPGASPFADFQLPHYQPGARVDAPAVVQNAPVFDELIVQSPGSSFVNAVVQAGGNVAINATQDLTNSVIREGISQSAGASRVGETGVSGNTATVVALNAQLPPDLAQQQVNPITLPGFTLPTGSNGLFRLSGQEGSQSSAQTISAGGSYDFAGQSISLSQRERALDSATGKAGDIQRDSDAIGLAGDIQRGATGMTGEIQRSDASGTSGDIPRSGGTGMSGDVQRISGTTGTADTVQLSNGAIAQGAAAGASLSVAQVQGVPSTARPDNRHKYLIETNPELTSLKSFLSSDYLLGLLGYDPDKSQKRLGDGLYEQRLIRDAVVARTGQRYINGITDDENLFKYLMDNAIAYKDKVHLSLGVALTAEQVAALTHDLVWLEEAEVNGEKVLVPVLYLAQANNRLAPNGALIMGNDVSLISGGNLVNQGTLRASGNLSASAANLDNTGLIEASGRLDLLALNNLSNHQGGIISGRDVSLTSLTGDVINQRSVTVHEGGIGNRTWTQSFADSTARIEAAGKLEISAGRDINNLGGAISSGSDLSMQAGRDINLHSVELENSRTSGRNFNQSTTQLGSDISVGRDFTVEAGRDISVVGSRIEVGRDAGLSAGRDVTLASAADEQHSYDKSKKVTAQEDHVTQRGTELSAGRDVLISAGQDLTLISSKIGAGNEAYLVAGDKIKVLAANDSDYSLYDKKDKGSWGSKQTRHDEVTDVKAVSSEISAGGDITLLSGGDQKYQAAKLDSGNDIAIVSGGAVTFEAVKDLHQEAHSKENSDLSWSSSSGKGKTDESLRQSELIAQGNLAIKAVDGLKIDYKQIDQQSVSQAIDAMVKADPNLAWLKDAEARGDVDWRAVKEFHDSYSYSQSGMGPATQLAVAIAAAAIGGMAAAGALSGAGVAGGTFAMGAGVGAAGSLAGTAGVSLINNKGDLGKVLSDSFSSDNLKQMAIASLTGGLTAEYFNSLSGADTHTKIVGGKTVADLSSWGGVGSFAASQGMQNFTSTALSQALDQGGSFGDALKNSLYNTFAAAGFNQVGDIGAINGYAPGSAPMVAMHALMGGLASVVSGGDFATGAVAAGANEAMVASLDGTFKKLSPDQREQLLTTSSQLVGLVATAAVIQNASTDQLETGVWAAKNSTQYNYLFHEELDEMARKIQGCGKDTDCKDRIGLSYAELDQQRNNAFPSLCQSDLAACGKIAARLMAEDPQNVELALSLHKAQTVGLEAVISTNYIQSNRMAMDTATSEYLAQTGGTTELLKMALAQSAAGGLIGGSGSSFNKLVAKGASEAAAQIPGRVQSRINIADGRTATTPLRDNGNPVSAGFDHVLKGHFDVEVSNSRSVFTVSPSELKGILQSSSVVKSPVTAMPDGQFVRTVDVGRVIGTSTLKDGGVPTSVIKVFTDRAGNLITAFPVKAPN